MTEPTTEPRAAWMFKDNEPGSLYDTGQKLWTAWTRILVVTVYRPLKPLLRWLTSNG